MAGGRKTYYDVQAPENEVKIVTGKFVTNGTSAPDGIEGVCGGNGSVTRTAAGKFTVVFDKDYPAVLYASKPTVVGAAGYESRLTSIDTGATGNVTGCKMEIWTSGVTAAATGTLTLDALADATDGDYVILNDGQKRYGFEMDKAGDGASLAADGVGATATITCDSRTNSADNEQFIISDGGRSYYCEIDTNGSGATVANTDIVIDISAATDTAAGSGVVVQAAIAAHAIGITAVDNLDGTVSLTQDNKGDSGNVANNIYTATTGAWAVTNFTGGTDPITGVDVWTNVDISGDTTAIDVAASVNTAINGTSIQITSAPPGVPDGTLDLTNDDAGAQGNTQQEVSGGTNLAVTDMTGGSAGDAAAADTTDYDVYLQFTMRESKLTFR